MDYQKTDGVGCHFEQYHSRCGCCFHEGGFFPGRSVASRSYMVEPQSPHPLLWPGNQATGGSPNAVYGYVVPGPCFEDEYEFDLTVPGPLPFLPDLLQSGSEKEIKAEKDADDGASISFSIQPRPSEHMPGSLPQTLPLRRTITMPPRSYLFRPIEDGVSRSR